MPQRAVLERLRRGPGDIVAQAWTACGPEQAATRLRDRPGLAWLDSALPVGRCGRWSIVASDPRWTLTAPDDSVASDAAAVATHDPIATLAAAIERETAPASARWELPAGVPRELPFIGGAIGYLGFELARHIERLPATTLDDTGTPELAVGWYDAALVWDHLAARGWVVGRPAAVAALRARLDRAERPAAEDRRTAASGELLHSNFTHEEYLAAVRRAREYIAAGDIYQVNLSQRFTVRTAEAGLDLYRRLRAVSPAPFAAYLALGGIQVLSSSPERLLLADGARLETRPIKGTRPRGATPAEDDALAAELLASAKDAAEHVMIVDLERNDLGRVSEVGTVRVPELAALERFAQVHHLTSTVVGRRRADAGLAELLRAVFPGGSISGAPKIRALEIIDELEPTARGVYTGAIGYWSASGRMDLNIAIRTITLHLDGPHPDGWQSIAHMQVGGAIVYDSDPEAEYRETLDKARGMARALGVRLPDEGPAAPLAVPAAARAG